MVFSKNSKSPSPLFGPLDDPDHPFLRLLQHEQYDADIQISGQFLQSYKGSQATFNAYRREVERLLQWLFFIKKTDLKSITRQHIEAFIEFCRQPPLEWIGLKNVPRYKLQGGVPQQHEDWRPFVVRAPKSSTNKLTPKDYVLSQSAQESILRILSSYFTFLEQEMYIEQNPVKRIRQKSQFIRKTQGQSAIRRLSELQWSYVIDTATEMADKEPHHERTLFIMSALYGMYLRISELSASPRWTPRMNHFFMDQDGHWWFKTVGKGNKERDISVSKTMQAALFRYRCSMGMTNMPTPADQSALLPKNKGLGAISSTRHIRRIVQECFDESIHKMNADGFGDEAEQLKAATVHWLRHTGISDDVKIRPREHVRDDAGHTNSSITDKYIDIDRRERHASAANKQLRGYQDEPASTDVSE
ncbi:MAG TPA: integrase [Gammaproteobacteria bacterium]|nr:integrase [Gammaproteobacteria bacterium]HCK94371.1 integrase [Gammaproteobacteria bacterium]|tara:strand:- start:157 stop:1407 length:1251 start_codon:yes stop_codon:yes gene_type:complete